MSLPINEFVWCGVWNNSTSYRQYQFVQSPIDLNCYVNVNIQPITGGSDPSVQPSSYWVLIPPNSITAGVSSLNTLTGALSIVSGDAIIQVATATPQIELTANLPAPYFAPAYGSFSSTQTQPIAPSAVLPLVYDTEDVSPVNCAGIGTSTIKVASKGVYRVLTSVQMNKTTGGNGVVELFPAINTNPVANSATKLNINQTEENVMTVEWYLNMNGGDEVSINLYSTDTGIEALAVPASPPVPAVPSIITTILRIA